MYQQTAMIDTIIGGHVHKLQLSDMPSHSHSGACRCVETVFEDNDFVISLRSGKMYDMRGHYDVEEGFLNKMCQCIISKYAGHEIEMFKAGQSELLKEKILEFLKET